jgi:hypothetical protein
MRDDSCRPHFLRSSVVQDVRTLETPSRALRDHLVAFGFSETRLGARRIVIEYRAEDSESLHGAVRDFMHDAIARGEDVELAAALHALGSVPTRRAMIRARLRARMQPPR